MHSEFSHISFYNVPLCYDVVYYMESKNNKELNQLMRQVASSGKLLFNDSKVQPYPLKLWYISADDLSMSNLRTFENDDDYATLLDDIRECLNAEKGGTLTARCLPKFIKKVRQEDHTACVCTDFDQYSSEEALMVLQSFAKYVATSNFERLSGTSYSCYLNAVEEAQRPHRSNSGSPMFFSFMVVPQDPQDIVNSFNENISTISESITKLEGIENFIKQMEHNLTTLKKKCKYNIPFIIKATTAGIYVKLSEDEEYKINFGRCDVAETLYIFYLRNIERSTKKAPIYVSKVELKKHKRELLNIYEKISKRKLKNDIFDDLWDLDYPTKTFDRVLSSIRTYFYNEFDIETLKKEYGKCYSIEKKEIDPRSSFYRYGIDLDVNDFDLGPFSCKKM